MMKALHVTFLVAVAFLLASCSTVKVVTDVDTSVDFSTFKTYSFLGWQNNSDQIMNEMDKQRLQTAFKNELTARGLSFVKEGGDMEIALFIVVDQKTTTTAYTDYYGGAYGGYSRYRGGWGYGHSTTTYSESDYLVGTLVMDVFDGGSKSQIWQGIAKGTVNENPQKRETSIPKSVGKLMAEFPIQPKE